jgi:hypothetical protein
MRGSSDELVSGMSQAAFDDLHGSDEMAVEKLKHVSTGCVATNMQSACTQHGFGSKWGGVLVNPTATWHVSLRAQ